MASSVTQVVRSKTDKIEAIIQAIFLIGVVVFVVGVASYFNSKKQPKVVQSSLVERDLAQITAKSAGQKSYSFESNFTPGIGSIADPQAYLKQWQQQNAIK